MNKKLIELSVSQNLPKNILAPSIECQMAKFHSILVTLLSSCSQSGITCIHPRVWGWHGEDTSPGQFGQRWRSPSTRPTKSTRNSYKIQNSNCLFFKPKTVTCFSTTKKKYCNDVFLPQKLMWNRNGIWKQLYCTLIVPHLVSFTPSISHNIFHGRLYQQLFSRGRFPNKCCEYGPRPLL